MLVSSVCTHSGAFNLTAGELAVTGSLASASNLTVQAGAMLSGTGSIQGTVTQHGNLSPGIDGVAVIGVDEHVWRHTRRGDKYVTVIIDLTGIREGTGPARLLDMVEGRSKQAFK